MCLALVSGGQVCVKRGLSAGRDTLQFQRPEDGGDRTELLADRPQLTWAAASVSHGGRELPECLRAGVQKLCYFYYWLLFLLLLLDINTQISKPSTALHPPPSLFHAVSSHAKETVRASGIYQGWNVFGERSGLWIRAYSTCFMRKYWIALNFHNFFSPFTRKRIIFPPPHFFLLYPDPRSVG